MELKDTNKIPAFLKRIKQLKNVKIRVGILGDDKLAVIAKANEYGTHTEDGKVRIPERSFLRITFDDKSAFGRCIKFAERVFDLNQKIDNVPAGIGSSMMSEIQSTIDVNIPPPNKESTVERKGSDHTLIDTGRLRQGISFKVV